MSEHSAGNLDLETGQKQKKKRGVGTFRLAASGLILLFTFVIWGWLLSGKLKAEEIISGSMAPTIDIGDRIIVEEIEVLKEIQRGEVVVIEGVGENDLPLLKRVIGIPGDFIFIVNDKVYLNEDPSDEQLEADGISEVNFSYALYLPEKMFFVLGDNRDESLDSRNFGPITRRSIIGKALFTYYPIDKAGWIEKADILTNEENKELYNEKYNDMIKITNLEN